MFSTRPGPRTLKADGERGTEAGFKSPDLALPTLNLNITTFKQAGRGGRPAKRSQVKAKPKKNSERIHCTPRALNTRP